MKGIVISSQNRNKYTPVTDYPLQDYYYIPVEKNLHVNLEHVVYEGQLLSSDTHILHHSPVAGTITNILSYQEQKYIEIQRDLSETPREYLLNSLQGLPSDVLLERIKNAGIAGTEGNDEDLYSKLQNAQKKTQYLVINGLDTEPFLYSYLLEEKIQEIIQTIFQLKYILQAKEIIIAITKNATLKKSIEMLLFDKNIKIVETPNIYPLFQERLLIDHLFHKEISRFQDTIKENIIVLNTSTIYAIYEALFYQKPFIEKVINIEGAYCLAHGSFRVKIGTPISAFMRPFSIESSYVMFSGGPLTGQTLDKEKSLSKKMNAVMIFEGQSPPQETFCISCARCVQHCPIRLEPIKLIDFIQHKEYDLATQHYVDECIGCNICSYVCPSFIPLGKIITDHLRENPHA
ncbi:MAG: 4Fe-4S dicluster domain-containing protein [Brevinema sp.]